MLKYYSHAWLRWSQTPAVPSTEEPLSAEPNWELSIARKEGPEYGNKVPNVFLQDVFTYYNTGRHQYFTQMPGDEGDRPLMREMCSESNHFCLERQDAEVCHCAAYLTLFLAPTSIFYPVGSSHPAPCQPFNQGDYLATRH